MNTNQASTLALVFALFFSSLGAPMFLAGTAAAAEDGEVGIDECDSIGEFVIDQVTFANFDSDNPGDGWGCELIGEDDKQIYQNKTEQQRKTLIAAEAVEAKQDQANYITAAENTRELSRNDALFEARQEYIKSRMNGKSPAEARSEAKERVRNMYTAQQNQLMNNYETQVVGAYCPMAEQWADMGNRSQVAVISFGDRNPVHCQIGGSYTSSQLENEGGDSGDMTEAIVDDDGYAAVELTLINGSNTTTRTMGYEYDSTTFMVFDPTNPDANTDEYAVSVNDPDGSYVRIAFTDAYADTWQDIKTQNNNTQNTLGDGSGGYLADLETAKQNQNLTWTELLVDHDPTTLENTTDEPQDYYDRTLGMSMDGPSLSTDVTIEYTDGNTTVTKTGHLYSLWAPPTDPDNDSSGEWVTGHVYNGSAHSQAYLGAEDGTLVDLGDREFTITKLQQGGENVSSTDHKQITIDTSDTSDFKNKTDLYNERYDNITIEVTEDDGGGAGSGDGGSSPRTLVLVGLLGLVGGVLYAMTNNGGGGRRRR
jgi:hypothetical protein